MEDTFATLGHVEAVRRLFEGTGYEAFEQALSIEAKEGDRVVNSSRTLLEGVDFDLVYFPLKHLGYKSTISVTGELYAALAHPKTLNVSMGVSAKLDYGQVKEIWSGIISAAHEHGYEALALDLHPSRNGLCISMSASGTRPLLSSKRKPAAQSKDLICISGSLGAAYLGMQVLERGKLKFENGGMVQEDMEKYKMLVAAYLKPELEASSISRLEDAEIYPSLGYFVTKGLSDAILRLVRDSGMGAKIYADKIPFEGNSFSLGKEINVDPVSAAMNGGEDFRLLFTLPILQFEKFRKEFPTFDIIGHLALPEVGAVLVTPEGVELGISAQGWKENE